jgi:hypothetical protein
MRTLLGPRAENFSLLKELFAGVLDEHAVTRELYHPEDGVSAFFETKLPITHNSLNRLSLPTRSRSPQYTRPISMLFDRKLPSLVFC